MNTNIILDDYPSHCVIQGDAETKPLVQHLLDTSQLSQLTSIGITVTVASSKRNQKVGRSEMVIQRIKEILINSLQTLIFSDYFDLTHKVRFYTLKFR